MRVALFSGWVVLFSLGVGVAGVRAQAAGETTGGEASAGRESSGAEQAKPEDLRAARQAREHFLRGVEHFEAHRYREAIRRFRLAAALVPSADLWFNIARAHEQLGEYAEAAHFYRLYLRDRVDPPDAEEVRKRIESLDERAAVERKRGARSQTGLLQVHAEQEGAGVEVADRILGTSPLSERVPLPSGRYRVHAKKEGYIPFQSEVEVEPGQRTAAYVGMEPETRFRSVRGDHLWTWVTGGAAAAALITSAVLGGVAVAQPDGALDDTRRWARYSDIALGTGLVLGVGTAVLYFLEGRVVHSERIDAGAPPP